MSLISLETMQGFFKDKTVVVMGSAPSVLKNNGSIIEAYDCIVRVNNYKTHGTDLKGERYDYRALVGERVDYHYSFYGGSIRTTAEDLKAAGCKAHLCKCPNDDCHVTDWHKENNFPQGGDFRPIYRRRHDYWIAPVYIPTKEHYMTLFNMLKRHVPTTGFMAIWELLQCDFKKLYITGYDFMTSQKHNINEMWRPGRQDDPIKHEHNAERLLLRHLIRKHDNIELDKHLNTVLYS